MRFLALIEAVLDPMKNLADEVGCYQKDLSTLVNLFTESDQTQLLEFLSRVQEVLMGNEVDL